MMNDDRDTTAENREKRPTTRIHDLWRLPYFVNIKFGEVSKARGVPITHNNETTIGYDLDPDEETMERVREGEKRREIERKKERKRRRLWKRAQKRRERQRMVKQRKKLVAEKLKLERERIKQAASDEAKERNSAQIKAFDYIYYHRLMRFLESEGFIVDEYESRKEEMNHSIESQLNQFISSDEDEEKGSQSEEMVQVDSAEVIREMHPDDMMQPDWQGLLAMCLQADKRKMWAEHYEKCVLVKNVDTDAGTPKQK
ncbi:golgin subfamily A member 6-like protein 26 [Oscarella lobularis]|uniref:golgin subfamily A member 6-like protein 26 n=1 Tax=Oscarella lobularis TaxID=121494 RepID=UPI0033133E20